MQRPGDAKQGIGSVAGQWHHLLGFLAWAPARKGVQSQRVERRAANNETYTLGYREALSLMSAARLSLIAVGIVLLLLLLDSWQ